MTFGERGRPGGQKDCKDVVRQCMEKIRRPKALLNLIWLLQLNTIKITSINTLATKGELRTISILSWIRRLVVPGAELRTRL